VVAIIAWLLFLLPAVLLSVPIWLLGRKRAGFRRWEAIALILPFIIWLLCFQLLPGSKSLRNIVEALVLGCAVPIGVLSRVIVGGNLNRNLMAAAVMGLACAVAVLLAAMFPEVTIHWFH